MKDYVLATALALSAASTITTRCEVRYLAEGHTDLAVNYDAAAGKWDFHVGSDSLGKEFPPDEVILKVKDSARTNVPSAPNFEFLGAANSTTWILPEKQNEELLYLGYGGEGVPEGVFTNDQVQVSLKSVSGPGNFFSYRLDSFGNPQVLFNSADGVSSNDVATVQSGGDAHLSWAFSQAGEYTVILEASGVLASGQRPSSSGPVAFRFSVGAGPKILDTGHTDLAIDFNPDENTWDFHVGSDAFEESYDPVGVILLINGDARTPIPESAAFSFLGQPRDSIWILPGVQDERLLFLGYGGEGIPEGIFAGNAVQVTLKSSTGPGDFFSYNLDEFGNPHVLFNTRDGISTNDVALVQAGGDAHLSWAFAKAGDYSVTLEVSGTLAETETIVSSGPITFRFSVLMPPARLTNEHVDLRVNYEALATNKLSIVARDEDHRVNYASDEVILVVPEQSELTLPAGTPFGNEGDKLWTLPQSQNPNLLYLGISAEGIPSGAFTGDLQLRLRSIEGPGRFFLWQAVGFGNYNVVMNTADGITDADRATPLIGSHEHYNWGFTSNGVYRATLEVSGNLSGSTNLVSPLTTFTFHVLPLPTNAAPVEIVLQVPESFPAGGFAFDLVAPAALSVEIQTTENLKDWISITNLVVTTPPMRIVLPETTTKHRFFRGIQK